MHERNVHVIWSMKNEAGEDYKTQILKVLRCIIKLDLLLSLISNHYLFYFLSLDFFKFVDWLKNGLVQKEAGIKQTN